MSATVEIPVYSQAQEKTSYCLYSNVLRDGVQSKKPKVLETSDSSTSPSHFNKVHNFEKSYSSFISIKNISIIFPIPNVYSKDTSNSWLLFSTWRVQ